MWRLAVEPRIPNEEPELGPVCHALWLLALDIFADVEPFGSLRGQALSVFALWIAARGVVLDAFHVCCPFNN